MKRQEALKHFEEEYCSDAFIDMNDDIHKYIEENRKELTVNFVENFRTLCKKIKEMQKAGDKGKIAYITYSFGIDNLQKASREYMVHAYGKDWFFEDSKECSIMYDAGWIYNFLDDTYEKLLKISKKYMGNIEVSDLEKIWKDGVKDCDAGLRHFTKKAVKIAAELEDFNGIDKEEILEIRIGEYKGYNEIIHKIDTRVKDSKEMKLWLESYEKSYAYSILKNLDLSGGNFEEISCHESDFSGSDLSDSSFENANLIGTAFIKSVINRTNFRNSVLSDTDFHDTELRESNFEEARMRGANFENAQIIDCSFENAICRNVNFSCAVFKNTSLRGVNFGRADLENSDLCNNDLTGSYFIGTNLKGANLSGADLTGAEFVEIDFTTFNFDNAIFGENKVKKVKIFRKDVEQLNISEEQRKELTIIG